MPTAKNVESVVTSFLIIGSPEEQDNLLSSIYDKTKERSSRLTCGGLERTVRDLSDSKEFRKVFGDAAFEKEHQLIEAFSQLRNDAAKRAARRENLQLSGKLLEIGMALRSNESHEAALLFEIYDTAKAEGGSITCDSVLRAMKGLSTSDAFRKIFGTISFEEEEDEEKALTALYQVSGKIIAQIASSGNTSGLKEVFELQTVLPPEISDESESESESESEDEVEPETPPAVKTGPSGLAEETPKLSQPETPPPDPRSIEVQALVREFKSRKRGTATLKSSNDEFKANGYIYDEAMHESDRKRLLGLIKSHNDQFAHRLDYSTVHDPIGFVERLDLTAPSETEEGDIVYVRADVHSDLSSLLAQLRMHQQAGDMDEQFRCREGFHIIFLGDYMDRGINDIEVLSLLLSLHLKNPDAVHLLRGNHEELMMSRNFSLEGPWLEQHADIINPLFQSFPLALCAGVRKKKGPIQYVHFSHGLFSPRMNLAPLFKEGAPPYIAVPNYHWMSGLLRSNPQGSPDRRRLIASERLPRGTDQTTVPASKGEPFHPMTEATMIRKWLDTLGRKIPVSPYEGYVWTDISNTLKPSPRGAGYEVTPQEAVAYGSVAGGSVGTIIAFVRGHQHEPKEWVVYKGRDQPLVAVTTLPVGTLGGSYGETYNIRFSVQGLCLTPSENVCDWKKRLVVEQGGEFITQEESRKMQEPIF